MREILPLRLVAARFAGILIVAESFVQAIRWPDQSNLFGEGNWLPPNLKKTLQVSGETLDAAGMALVWAGRSGDPRPCAPSRRDRNCQRAPPICAGRSLAARRRREA